MIKKVLILFLLTVLYSGLTLAHQDFTVTRDYGNVAVRIKTGFEYEEIQKVFIIGQLAEKLAEKLNYKNPVFLDFSHNYTRDSSYDYFISYDDGSFTDVMYKDERKKSFRESEAIVIRQISRTFDISVTLKLLEYAILNLGNIKSTQTEIEYRNF